MTPNAFEIAVRKDEEVASFRHDKLARYGWTVKDKSGALMFLDKHALKVEPEYQRAAIAKKTLDLARTWSWISCGALVVAQRDDGYWVIDGQHRVLAARKRSDITTLPCVVFNTEDIRQEATAFLDCNTHRATVSIIDKFRAMIVSGDQDAVWLDGLLRRLGQKPAKTAYGPGDLGPIGFYMRCASQDKPRLERIATICAELAFSAGKPVPHTVAQALWYLDKNMGHHVDDLRFKNRLFHLGIEVLAASALRAAALYAKGAPNIYASGILEAVNKKLRIKFVMEPND